MEAVGDFPDDAARMSASVRGFKLANNIDAFELLGSTLYLKGTSTSSEQTSPRACRPRPRDDRLQAWQADLVPCSSP
jgi:hypothetical protein